MIPIHDFPYLITECGQVYREGSVKPLTRVVHKDTGYLMVSLWKENQGYTFYVHVLTAKVYVPNPHNKKFVNHKDGNKQNPHKDNLEWCTRSENMLHAYSIGLCSQAHKKVLTDTQADVALATILDGVSLTAVAKTLSVGLTTLHHYVNAAAHRLNLYDALQTEYAEQKKLRNLQANESRKLGIIKQDLNGKPLAVYESICEAAKANNLNSGNISNCIKGRAKTCGGFKWILK